MKKCYKNVLSLENMMTLRDISDVKVSPIGNWIVFTVREAIMDAETSDYRMHIHLVNIDGTNHVQLITGEESCYEPQWSPDGCWISFISARTGKNNIWLTMPDNSECYQLTDSDTSISSYKWSPDGNWIAYIALDPVTDLEEKDIKGKTDVLIPDENIKMYHL